MSVSLYCGPIKNLFEFYIITSWPFTTYIINLSKQKFPKSLYKGFFFCSFVSLQQCQLIFTTSPKNNLIIIIIIHTFYTLQADLVLGQSTMCADWLTVAKEQESGGGGGVTERKWWSQQSLFRCTPSERTGRSRMLKKERAKEELDQCKECMEKGK